jgi:hypothetical protein
VRTLSSLPRIRVNPHLRLIALIGVIVPRRLRADWRQEWETELQRATRMNPLVALRYE